MSDDSPRPGTNAAIEARISRLEIGQANFALDIGIVKLEQTHQREMLSSLGAKFDRLDTKLDMFFERVTATAGDPLASAAGRQFSSEIKELQVYVEGMRQWRDNVNGILTVLRWIGPTGLLIALGTLAMTALRIEHIIP